MNSSISWVGILLVIAVLGLLVQGPRMTRGGWIGCALKGVLVTLIVLVLGVVWNTLNGFPKPK